MSLPVRARPVVLVLGFALGLAACGDDNGTTATEATTTTAGASATSTHPPSDPSTTGGRVIQVAFRGGAVSGAARQQVRRGETVRLVVSSDVADEVHVHGYDKTAAIGADGTVELSFTADIPGVFEVELEQRGRRLLTLEVTA